MSATTVGKRGFTIVELIIVVAVIAILAAITIVAYNGIQQKSQSVSVQHDMRNMAKQIALYRIDNFRYPSAAQLQTLGIRVNKQTYGVNPVGATIFYCTNTAGTAFSIVARVKSQLCLDSGVPGTTGTMDYTGFTNNGDWNSWVLG